MSDGPHEIGRLDSGGDVLAVSWQRGNVLLGHPNGWPIHLNAAKRREFMRLWARAEANAEAWRAGQAEAAR